MKVLSVNQFRANIKTLVDQAIADHEPVKVTRRAGQDFIIVSAEDWDRDQETLYVMQNSSIINQIRESILTHDGGTGYAPTQEELDDINRI
jgi:antitoxin YefM